MTIRLVDTGWKREIAEGVSDSSDELCIIAPFIKTNALDHFLNNNPRKIRVITRFSLSDCADGVNDLSALRRLMRVGATIRGVRHLHAKLYLFGNSRAIVTSANLTSAALDRNHELGVVSTDPGVVAECRTYFDKLWNQSGANLAETQLEDWEQIVSQYLALGARSVRPKALCDFGVVVNGLSNAIAELPPRVANAPQAFVKFLGEGHNRKPLSYPTLEEIERAGCHWAVAYPKSKRPTGVQEGALMFISRLTSGPQNDIRVFGRAIGLRHVRGRDEATADDIEKRGWKSQWSQYIRLHHAEFLAGTLGNGVSLNELMDELGPRAFESTKRNFRAGKGNTDPRKAYLQQAAVELSEEGLSWLSSRLQIAFETFGVIPRETLEQLDWPSIDFTHSQITARDAVLRAMRALGGTRSISEVKKWIKEQGLGSWRDIGTTMSDSAFPPPPSMLHKADQCFLIHEKGKRYSLRPEWH